MTLTIIIETITITILAMAPVTQQLDTINTTTLEATPTTTRATSRISQPMCK